jgi:hypothetical protein
MTMTMMVMMATMTHPHRWRRSLPRRNPPGEPVLMMVTPPTWRTTMTMTMTMTTTTMTIAMMGVTMMMTISSLTMPLIS